MSDYYLGYLYSRMGNEEEAGNTFARAEKRNPDYVFPYCHLDIAALETAVQLHPDDARAWQ